MTAPVLHHYEFGYTTVDTGAPTTFGLSGIEEPVAQGIREGLRAVASITNVTAVEVMQQRSEVDEPLPGKKRK